ncbi:hypothetical protein DPMN_174808 [Dreissena polymorpha]|uniref:Uncharacterized protein n=1 Tax=Dreissena polymorpha TaxID=45954 RepID=A0A9D4E860_DREPO|nr:hypothetical protein DPMN_174808 [Dreissena polymorpha]
MFVAGVVPRAAADYSCRMFVAGVVPIATADYRCQMCVQVLYLEQLLTTGV